MLRIQQGDLETLFEKYDKIVLFGAGALTVNMFEAYKALLFEEKIDYIIDNDPDRDGKIMQINGKTIRLVSVESFCNMDYGEYALLIMPVFMLDIVKQLDELDKFNDVPTYIYALLMNTYLGAEFPIRHTKKMKIPKIIHYCWFGKSPIPDKYKKNIASWRKYCPDYEIVEWNETNYDVKKNRFMYQAGD